MPIAPAEAVGVRASATTQVIVACTPIEHVVAGAADQGVVAAAAQQAVIAAPGIEQIVEFGAAQHVIRFRRAARHPALERRVHGLRHVRAQGQQRSLEARHIQPVE